MVFRESQMCCETKLLLGSNKTKIVQAENFVNVHDVRCISNYLKIFEPLFISVSAATKAYVFVKRLHNEYLSTLMILFFDILPNTQVSLKQNYLYYVSRYKIVTRYSSNKLKESTCPLSMCS